MTSVVEFGKIAVSLEDFCKVVYNCSKLSLNSASLAQLGGSGDHRIAPETPPVDPESARLSIPQTRALIAARILGLLEAQSSIRAEVVLFLVALLNNDITPCVFQNQPLQSLVRYCLPSGQQLPVLVNSIKTSTLGEALTAAGVEAIGVTSVEYDVFVNNQSASLLATSWLAVLAYEGQQLADLCDYIAALSCEDFQVSADVFAKQASRPHKQSNLVVSHLQLLLQHVPSATCDSPAFASIPDQHGAARGLLDAASSFAKVELNSVEVPKGLPSSVAPVISNLWQVLSALLVFGAGSERRVCVLQRRPDKQYANEDLSIARRELKTAEFGSSCDFRLIELVRAGVVGVLNFEVELAKSRKSGKLYAFLKSTIGERLHLPLSPEQAESLRRALTTSQQICAPKIPLGTQDTDPGPMAIRERVFGLMTQVFQRHGAVGIDTPIFERKEVLTGKYGDDSKVIYDLADQGPTISSSRYLTIPIL